MRAIQSVCPLFVALMMMTCTPAASFVFQQYSGVVSRCTVSRTTTVPLSMRTGTTTTTTTDEDIVHQDAVKDRRSFLQQGLVVAISGAAATVAPQPAAATYSAYTHREEDWQNRLDKGQVKISSARDLRRQLREIAPMNDEGSKIFCPNGPSSAVSPLMENKCGDREAIPSVYGRTQDTVGNSIPGFKPGYASSSGGSSASIAAEIGGFPSYNK